MASNRKDADRQGAQRQSGWTAQARVPRAGASGDPNATQYTQYDQYGNPLDDGFGYTPETEDFAYDGTDDSGYGVPVDPDVYAASQQDEGYSDAGYDYEYDGGGYHYYPEYDGRAERPPQQTPPPKRRLRHKGLVIFLVVIAAIVGLYVAFLSPIDAQLAFDSSEAEGLSQQESPHIPLVPYYVLALGSDAREGDTTSRTDTMILCRIDPIASKVTLVSIPRDTRVELEGYGTSKINAAYAYGGVTLATEAVANLTGVSASHVAVVHFDQLAELIDAIGGITVEVPVDVNDPYYTGLVMSAGTYQMDGQTALLFSRVRHGFATGDFQRQADQQIVIKAVIDKVLTLNPAQIFGLVGELGDVVSTDMRMYELLPLLLRFQITSPTMYTCSLPGESTYIGGVSYVVCDDTQVRQLMAQVDAGQDPNATDSNAAAASNGSLSSTS